MAQKALVHKRLEDFEIRACDRFGRFHRTSTTEYREAAEKLLFVGR
jgi:hypothetical protein